MVENNTEILKGNKFIKIVVSVFFICIAIIIISALSISYANRQEAYNYQQEVSEYLTNKYGEEFDIEFKRKGYKKKEHWLDSTFYLGRDKNVIQYLYTFSPKDNENIVCYIVYWYEKDTGNSEISEIDNGAQISEYIKEVNSYEENLGYYNNKLAIKDELEMYLGDDYNINLYKEYSEITVKTKKKLKNIILEENEEFLIFYNNLNKLLEDKKVDIIIWYKDYNLEITGEKLIYLNGKAYHSVDDMSSHIKSL